LTRALRTLGGSAPTLDAAQTSGVIAATLLLVGAAAVMTGTMADVFGRISGDDPLTSPAVALAPQFGYVLVFLPAMWATALTIGLIAWSGWTARIWPTGLSWLSIIAVALLPLSWLIFMPIALLPLWVLGVTLWAWRTGHRHHGDGTAQLR
jgi:hypothetical protein